jgi:hypothetical protein
MEYIILNKKLKIPALGYFYNPNTKNELVYYPKYNILASENIFIFLDFKNKYNNYLKNYKENFYVAPLINDIKLLKMINQKTNKLKFIIIKSWNKDILDFCKNNLIIPILILNSKNIDSINSNYIKNFKLLTPEIRIKILIEYGLLIIIKNKINNFRFDIFLGDIILGDIIENSIN